MLIKKAINERFLKVLFAGFISYYFGLIILQYNFKAVAFLGLGIFLFIFLTRVEYAFYFLLVTRSIIDIFYSIEVSEGIRMTHFTGVLVTLLFLYYIVVVSRYNIFNILSLSINKIYGIFLLFSIPSIFFCESLVTGLGYWFRLLQGFLILNMTILIILSTGSESYKKKMNIISWVVIISSFIPFVLFYKNYILGTYRVVSGYMRYTTFGPQMNLFGYHLLVILPFCLFLYSISTPIRKSKKILWLIFMAMIIFTIYTTYTRNVWIGLVILLLAWNVIRKNFKNIFFFIGPMVLLAILNPTVQERLKDIPMLLTSDKSFFELDPKLFSNRIGLWQINIRHFITRSTLIEKLFGNGFDIMYKIEWPSYKKQASPEHSMYIFLLMTTGICGLSLYVLYIFKLFKESFKLLRGAKEIYLRNLAVIFIPCLLSYVIISFVTQTLRSLTFQYYFSAFAGFVIAANILEKNKNKEGNGIIN